MNVASLTIKVDNYQDIKQTGIIYSFVPSGDINASNTTALIRLEDGRTITGQVIDSRGCYIGDRVEMVSRNSLYDSLRKPEKYVFRKV